MFLQCINCKEHHEITNDTYFCSKCNDILEVINKYNNNPINKSDLLSAGKNTPFGGWELDGKVTHTILGGKLVFNSD